MQKHQWTETIIGSCLALFVTSSWGQPSPAQIQMQQQQQINNMLGDIQTQDTLRRGDIINQQQNAARNAARQRAWQAREDAILRKIDQYRSTPYYGSFAVNPHDNTAIYWSGGGKISAELSQKQALELCGHADCKILKTFSNACAAITFPIDKNEMFVSVDPSPQKAIDRAEKSCAVKYSEKNCRISLSEEKNSYAYCSGYDYGAYNQK